MSRRVVLLGEHIGYSASPAIHNAAFAACGLDLRYELADVSADVLAARVEAVRGEGGANVTQPHKLAVMELLDSVTSDAQRVGAVNTIVVSDGRLSGHNTDLPAIAAELIDLAPDARRAVVLGTGGASRATVLALADAGIGSTVVSRGEWDNLPDLLSNADLVVNATPVGTATDESPVDASWLRSDVAVLDLVYRPSPTRLVREARSVGAPAADGAGVLLRQAAFSFTLWTGLEPPLGPMSAALDAELAHG